MAANEHRLGGMAVTMALHGTGPIGLQCPDADETTWQPCIRSPHASQSPRRDLRNLHSQLVPGTLSEAEFWASAMASVGASAVAAAAAAGQRKGAANAMKSLLPISLEEGGHRATVNLTEEVCTQILAERPHIRRAYLANVPHNLSKQEFWERYVRHYISKQVCWWVVGG